MSENCQYSQLAFNFYVLHFPLTHTHWTDSATILLSLKMFFIADRTHSISSRISIKSTSCATQHGPWGLVGLLSHLCAVKEEKGLEADHASPMIIIKNTDIIQHHSPYL